MTRPGGEGLLDRRFGELLESLAGHAVPASGTAAALVAAMAAELVAMAARAAGGWRDAPGIAAQARALSARLVPLAAADSDAFARVLELRSDPAADPRDLGPALERSAELPLAIADAAAATAELAAIAAEHCSGHEHADAIAAAALAEGAARAAASLVHVNLAVGADDGWAADADEHVRIAEAARRRASAAR